jgi:predicted dehydrogenase/uncharacterized membrane protein YbhN (UPF0104 family)
LRLRGALLGAGNIALRGHAPQLARDAALLGEIEIVALADLSPSNLDAARVFFPAAKTYADAEELLDREQLDFCDICTPPSTHRPLIEQAVGRGIHVLSEKPLAPSITDAERISEAVRAAGVVFQPCHQYHYSPQWQAVRRLLPRLGRIYFAEYEVQRTEANEGNSNWSPGWRTDREVAGGGILVDHGAHIFYQLRAILGEPKTVQATVRTLQHHSYRVEDTALVVLDFGGCLARVSLTWAARRRAIEFRFVGERGELVGDDRSVRIHADVQEDVCFDDGLSRDSSHSEWYAPLIRGFAERVRSGDAGTDPLDEALYVTRLITRAYQSSQEGRSLPLLGAPDAIELGSAMTDEASTLRPELNLDGSPDGRAAMPSAERRWRTYALRGGALVALLAAGAWTFHDVAWAPLWAALSTAHLGWIALAAAVNLGAVGFQAARWLALVRPLTRAATFAHAFKSLVVGFAVSTVVPARAGELARMQWFSRLTGLARASVVGSIVLDHLVNAAGLLLALAVLPLFLKNVPFWIRPGALFTLAMFTLGAMLVFALRPLRSSPGAAPPSQNLPVTGINGILVRVRQGLAATARPGALSLSLGASFVSWTLEVNVILIAMRAVGLAMPLAAAILVLLAVNLALAFPLAPPGNLGTLEVGATLALLGFGVAKEQALAFGLVYHFLQIIPIGILGLVLAGRAVDARVPA